jgi:two-component system OmpR family sensor kinase
MVSELIESLRLASGDLRLEPEPCDLGRLVADACEEFRLLQPGRDLRVLTSGPLVLRLDPDKITSVIENLLTNAVLHSGSSAPITVSLGHDAAERRAVLRVGDRGPGLPQARREEMTKPVVSFDAQGRVHGLGLFSVRLIVEAHGGRVWSETGSEGFAVCVGLPMENSQQL